jgi:hypothetical protein
MNDETHLTRQLDDSLAPKTMKTLILLALIGATASWMPELAPILVILVAVNYARYAWRTVGGVPARDVAQLTVIAVASLGTGYLAKVGVAPMIAQATFLTISLGAWAIAHPAPAGGEEPSGGSEEVASGAPDGIASAGRDDPTSLQAPPSMQLIVLIVLAAVVASWTPGVAKVAAPIVVLVVALEYARYAWRTLAGLPVRAIAELIVVAAAGLGTGYVTNLGAGPLIGEASLVIVGLAAVLVRRNYQRAGDDPAAPSGSSAEDPRAGS